MKKMTRKELDSAISKIRKSMDNDTKLRIKFMNKKKEMPLKELKEASELVIRMGSDREKLQELQTKLRVIDIQKEMPLGNHTIGKFNVKSGAVTVTDPCYDISVWCMMPEIKARNGEWIAKAIITDEADWGRRIAELSAYHEKHISRKAKWKRYDKGEVGVDSGQAGIFDKGEYHKRNASSLDDMFYEECGKQTLGNKSRGIVYDWGVVSSSGFGDGSYSAYTKSVNNEIVAVKIVFIGKDKEDEEIEE